MTRALIADADWPAKARDGRVDDIRPSSFDNFAWGEIHVGKPLAEPHNPQLGQQGRIGLAAGARAASAAASSWWAPGPAGLQAARIAAERGHDVTLFGASSQPGGKLRWEAGASRARTSIVHLIAWMERQAEARRREDRAWARRDRGRRARASSPTA